PAVEGKGSNDSPSHGQQIALPQTVSGKLDRAGSMHFFRFEAKKDQEVGVQVVLPPGSKLEPVLMLTDSAGRMMEERASAFFGLRTREPAVYALGIRDREFRGGPEFGYRLQVGDIPLVASHFPIGIQRGKSINVHVDGVGLGNARLISVGAPESAAIGSRIP